MEESTFDLLRIFMGVTARRSVKRATLRNELIKRGVSPYGVVTMLEEILFQIGNAADNRIEEIDAQLDENKKGEEDAVI